MTLDPAGSTYGALGTWDYTYDTGGNELSMAQASGMPFLAASAIHTYDTDHRLITTKNTDTDGWPISGSGTQRTSWYTYDDLGNRISHKKRTASAIGYAHDKVHPGRTAPAKGASLSGGRLSIIRASDLSRIP